MEEIRGDSRDRSLQLSVQGSGMATRCAIGGRASVCLTDVSTVNCSTINDFKSKIKVELEPEL